MRKTAGTAYPFTHGPSDIAIPKEVEIIQPEPGIPDRIRRFFGRTGKWSGAWNSPQTKGTYDAVLIIRKIYEDGADITYIVPDYPPWYVKKGIWETKARIIMQDNGRTVLSIPYDPSKTTIDCWFQGKDFKGIMYGRFMVCHILWRPLP
jgi:hypothetical protein